MSAFLRQIIALSLARLLLDLALPEGEAAQYAALGVELCMLLCMLRGLAGMLWP